MIDRERITREAAEELGWRLHADGAWFRFDREFIIWLPDRTRDALIDARCRIAELEQADDEYTYLDGQAGELAHLIQKKLRRLVLHEKDPKP